MKAIIRAQSHIWDVRGTHAGFKPNRKQCCAAIKDNLGLTCSPRTIERVYNEEKKLFEDGKGYRTKPNIDKLLREIEAERFEARRNPGELEDAADLAASTAPETLRKMHQYKLGPAHRKMVMDLCMPLTGMTGFGVRSVRAAASYVYKTHVANDASPEWVPSLAYCYELMKKDMGYSYRRVTGKRVNDSMSEKQQELFDLLIELMAADIKRYGVLLDFIIGSDEYGHHLFPQCEYTWAKKGEKEVPMDIYDDKRQFTGNIVHNARGEIVFWHGIYGGKTKKSLPTAVAQAQAGAENFIYGTSPNHWSNVEQKKKLLDELDKFRTRRLQEMQDRGLISVQAAKEAKMIVLLDCWPVNLSAEIRDYIKTTYKYMIVRYIPAGLTGGVQINDAYLHAPFKGYVRQQAEDWYHEEMLELLKRKRDGLSEADFLAATTELLRMPLLRDKSVEWTSNALKRISQASKDDKNNNLIKKGWHNIYGKIFDITYQKTAFESVSKREEELTEAKLNSLVVDVSKEELGTIHPKPVKSKSKPAAEGKRKKKARKPRMGERELTKEQKTAGPADLDAQQARSLARLKELATARDNNDDDDDEASPAQRPQAASTAKKGTGTKPAAKAPRRSEGAASASASAKVNKGGYASDLTSGSEGVDDESEAELSGEAEQPTRRTPGSKVAAKPSTVDIPVFAEEQALPYAWTSLTQVCAKAGIFSPKAQAELKKFQARLESLCEQAEEMELEEKGVLFERYKSELDKHIQDKTNLDEFLSTVKFQEAFSGKWQPTREAGRRCRKA
jgi:hypothetical protein